MLRNLHKNQLGGVLVEFALVMPVLLLFFMGGVELTRYVLVNQKLEKATNTIADVIAQSSTIQTTNLLQLMSAVDDMMQPYPFNSNARVIVTSVLQATNPPALPVVRWQYCGTGSGTLSATSRIGIVTGNAALPTDLTLSLNDDIVIAEIFYNYTPIFGSRILGTNTSLYKVAYFRPRLGALSSYTSTCP